MHPKSYNQSKNYFQCDPYILTDYQQQRKMKNCRSETDLLDSAPAFHVYATNALTYHCLPSLFFPQHLYGKGISSRLKTGKLILMFSVMLKHHFIKFSLRGQDLVSGKSLSIFFKPRMVSLYLGTLYNSIPVTISKPLPGNK